MFYFEVWIEGEEHRHTEIAESHGKAKYQYYEYLQDGIWEAPFGEIIRHLRCRKIGPANIRHLFGNKEQFESVCHQRNIEFAYQGMRIEVNGKTGTIVGGNRSSNLDVVFDGQWLSQNCHPGWMTKYFDENGKVIQDNTITDQSKCVDCGAFRSCKSLYEVTEESVGCEFSPSLFRPMKKAQ